MSLPSPSFPACSAAPPGRILLRTFSPSAGACGAAALPIPPALLPIPTGAALEPVRDGQKHPIRTSHWRLTVTAYRGTVLNFGGWEGACCKTLPMPVVGGVAILGGCAAAVAAGVACIPAATAGGASIFTCWQVQKIFWDMQSCNILYELYTFFRYRTEYRAKLLNIASLSGSFYYILW